MASLYPMNHQNNYSNYQESVPVERPRKKHVPRKFTFDFSKDKRLRPESDVKHRNTDADRAAANNNGSAQAPSAEQQAAEQSKRERERLEAQQRELRFRKIQEDRTLAMLRQAENRAMEQQHQQRPHVSAQQQQTPVLVESSGASQRDSVQRDQRVRWPEEQNEQKQRFDARASLGESLQGSPNKYPMNNSMNNNNNNSSASHEEWLSDFLNNKSDEPKRDTGYVANDRGVAGASYDKALHERLKDAGQVDAARRQAEMDLQHKQEVERSGLRPSKQSHSFLHTIASIFKNN